MELPTITKRNLRRVGIEIREERALHWMERGHRELEAYLARQRMFQRWLERTGR